MKLNQKTISCYECDSCKAQFDSHTDRGNHVTADNCKFANGSNIPVNQLDFCSNKCLMTYITKVSE